MSNPDIDWIGSHHAVNQFDTPTAEQLRPPPPPPKKKKQPHCAHHDCLRSNVKVDNQGRGQQLVVHRVHLNILIKKLLVEVASNSVVDVPLLLDRSRSSLVLEDGVVIPFPLQ